MLISASGWSTGLVSMVVVGLVGTLVMLADRLLGAVICVVGGARVFWLLRYKGFLHQGQMGLQGDKTNAWKTQVRAPPII